MHGLLFIRIETVHDFNRRLIKIEFEEFVKHAFLFFSCGTRGFFFNTNAFTRTDAATGRYLQEEALLKFIPK